MPTSITQVAVGLLSIIRDAITPRQEITQDVLLKEDLLKLMLSTLIEQGVQDDKQAINDQMQTSSVLVAMVTIIFETVL